MLKVVAALIEKEDTVLIARRSTGDPQNLGKWELLDDFFFTSVPEIQSRAHMG